MLDARPNLISSPLKESEILPILPTQRGIDAAADL